MKKKTEKYQVIFRTQTQHCGSNYADLEKLKVLTTHSKNLFNSIHYILRQVFIIRNKGLYTDKKLNKVIHSDINASFNIGRKFNSTYAFDWKTLTGKEFSWYSIPIKLPIQALSTGKSIHDFLLENKVAGLPPNLPQNKLETNYKPKVEKHLSTSVCK